MKETRSVKGKFSDHHADLTLLNERKMKEERVGISSGCDVHLRKSQPDQHIAPEQRMAQWALVHCNAQSSWGSFCEEHSLDSKALAVPEGVSAGGSKPILLLEESLMREDLSNGSLCLTQLVIPKTNHRPILWPIIAISHYYPRKIKKLCYKKTSTRRAN